MNEATETRTTNGCERCGAPPVAMVMGERRVELEPAAKAERDAEATDRRRAYLRHMFEAQHRFGE